MVGDFLANKYYYRYAVWLKKLICSLVVISSGISFWSFHNPRKL